MDHRADLLLQAPRAGQAGGHGGVELGDLPVEERQQQLVSIGEVGVAELLAHPGAGGDALHGRRVRTSLEDDLGGHVEELFPPLPAGQPLRSAAVPRRRDESHRRERSADGR